METYDEYNNYHFQTDFYGGTHPQPPHPLPYPLPHIPKFQGLTAVGTREIPYIPDVPNPGQGHADMYWQKLIEKVARRRVPTPEPEHTNLWLQNQWSRRSNWDEDYSDDNNKPENTPPQPPPSTLPSETIAPLLQETPRSRMSDITTASEYGKFYNRQESEGRATYRVTSGAKLPPI